MNLSAASIAAPQVDGHEVPSAVLERLIQAHESLQRQEFTLAETLNLEAVSMYPHHPLPVLFLTGTYLFWIQELEASKTKNRSVYEKFYKASEKTIQMAKAQGEKWPESAYPQFYLGGAYGSQGMVKVYQGKYWSAYKDGLKAIGYLKESNRRNPNIEDVYFGLGQFEYMSGRLAGVLQFFLRLRGDEEKGIALIERAAKNGIYSQTSSKAFLTTIFAKHREDWKRGAPYILFLRNRFPKSYTFIEQTVAMARGRGLDKEENRALLEEIAHQWDQGWRPPAHADIKFLPARLELAKSYLAISQIKKARIHLEAVVRSADKNLSNKAGEILKTLPLETP